MVRTEREFNIANLQLASVRAALEDNRKSLADEGYAPTEIEAGVSHLIASEAELASVIAFYEDAIQGNFEKLSDRGRGSLLIALRIHRGVSQKEMADLLGVSEAQVSRDERGEYYNITDERASRIANVLGKELISQLRDLEIEPAKQLDTVPC